MLAHLKASLLLVVVDRDNTSSGDPLSDSYAANFHLALCFVTLYAVSSSSRIAIRHADVVSCRYMAYRRLPHEHSQRPMSSSIDHILRNGGKASLASRARCFRRSIDR